MKLAIAAPTASAYSETFIQMQMERLPCALRIHGKPVATETVPGGAIQPLRSFRGILDVAIECGIKKKRWEGPQLRELARRLAHNKITTLLTNYGPPSLALLPLCRSQKVKLVAHFHGYDAHLRSVVEANRTGYQQLGRQASAVVAVSGKMVEALVELKIPREKIRLLRCGANESGFDAKSEFPSSPLFFAVGRFVDKKAPYLTLLAFRGVLQQFPDARLILAGDGPLIEATRNISAALGLQGVVEFPGVLPPAEVAAFMRKATAFVQHSITPEFGMNAGDSEGTPVTVLEAMLSALPVISTRHAGIGEVIENGKTGLLVEERDVDGMSRAMTYVARNVDEARRIGIAARQKALAEHTSEIYIRSLLEILTRP